MDKIHPLALVETGAQIASDATVEAFAIIKSQVRIGPGAHIKSHAYLDGQTSIGEGTVIWPGACIGTAPQDLKYRGAETVVEIGAFCEIRECVTINRATCAGEVVRVGDKCLIMAYAHIAHNCQLGSRVILSNNATLAGHVTVEEEAIVGGMTAVHQFARIGTGAMVGGMSRITRDVPPYTIGAGAPYRLGGLNLVGLQRRGVDLATRRILAKAFRLTCRSALRLDDALALIERECPPISELKHWVRFCRATKRGIIGNEVMKSGNRQGKCDGD